MTDHAGEVTRILQQGGDSVGEEILPHVYEELRELARRRMARERGDHTLQATALVHEAYDRLLRGAGHGWEDRGHFFAAASQAMQRVLVDHARKVHSLKRGGQRVLFTLGAAEAPVEFEPHQVLALHEALEVLATEDARAAEVTRMRFLVGLTVEETAKAMNLSERSVAREWSFAKARLTELLGDAEL